jgi:hypothetical protein
LELEVEKRIGTREARVCGFMVMRMRRRLRKKERKRKKESDQCGSV